MGEEPKSNNVLVFSLGAVIGVAVAVLAALFQRSRKLIPAAEYEELPNYLPASNNLTAGQSPSTLPSPVVPSASPRWTRPTKYIMGVILFLAAVIVLFFVRGVIPMVILAALLALFINPLIEKINRRFHLSWSVSTAIVYVLVIGLLILGIILLIPSLLNALNYLLSQDYQVLAGESADEIRSLYPSIQAYPTIRSLLQPLLEVIAQALENFSVYGPQQPTEVEVTIYSLGNELGERLGALADLFGPVVGVVAGGILILFMSLQMSLAANQLSGWYPDLIPPAYKEEYSKLFERITNTWISFLRGQITLMMIIGVIIWLGGVFLGVPYALLMGLLAGTLELIPNVGPILAAIPAVILSLLFGSGHLPLDNLTFALLVVVFYVLVQLLENQFIVPYVMGDAVDLPPLVVLIGAIAGAYAFGILGALLATPVIATGNLVFQFIYRKILEPPPIPAPIEEKPSIWESLRGWVKRIPLPGRKILTNASNPPSEAVTKAVDPPADQGVAAL